MQKTKKSNPQYSLLLFAIKEEKLNITGAWSNEYKALILSKDFYFKMSLYQKGSIFYGKYEVKSKELKIDYYGKRSEEFWIEEFKEKEFLKISNDTQKETFFYKGPPRFSESDEQFLKDLKDLEKQKMNIALKMLSDK